MKSIQQYKGILFFLGFVILVIPEILKVYYIMPLPGSQHSDHVGLAYTINQYIWVSRIIGGLGVIAALYAIFMTGKTWHKVGAAFMVLLAVGITYITIFVMQADHMFYQPRHFSLSSATAASDRNMLVIGVAIGGEAHAYPIEIIGYHHQVLDTVGGEAVMVTYCTVCRTGTVYKPTVGGKREKFRLVGMDQFNAMFEDATTHSWWRQATGECCAGPFKGQNLTVIPSQQMTLSSWLTLHPAALVMSPDPDFTNQYKALAGYANGTRGGSLTGSDTVSLHPKSWTVVINADRSQKVYDWHTLLRKNVINDKLGDEPIVLIMDSDRQSFYCFNRKAGTKELSFTYDRAKNRLIDTASATQWDMSGKCIEGNMSGTQLSQVQAYQEFYHAALAFHPSAEQYKD